MNSLAKVINYNPLDEPDTHSYWKPIMENTIPEAKYDLVKELEKLNTFYEQVIKEQDPESFVTKRLRLEKLLQTQREAESSYLKDIAHNRFDSIPETFLRQRYCHPASLTRGHSYFSRRQYPVTHPAETSNSQQKQGDGKMAAYKDLDRKSHKVNPLIEEKMQSVINNTSLVKSLLDDVVNPVCPSSTTSTKLRPSQLPVNLNQNQPISVDNSNNVGMLSNNPTFVGKMENFTNVVEDLLSVMKPLIGNTQCKSPQQEENISQHSHKEGPRDGYTDENQHNKPTTQFNAVKQGKMHNYNTYKDDRQRNITSAPISHPKKKTHKLSTRPNPHKAKPKALKRMQKIAREHNL